jgi:hypothetical protein
MKKMERLVFYYDLSISASSRNFETPKPISIRKALELIQSIPIDQRNTDFSTGREHFYISDWDWSGNTISILINKSDRNISDPVFTIPKEKKRRTAEKQDEEGQDFSIHIIVQLPNDDLDSALVIIEHCPGLGRVVVKRFLDRLLNYAKKLSPNDYEQLHPDGALGNDGKPKKYNVTFKWELNGYISDTLKYELDNGKIHSIELITEKEKFTPFDEDGYIQEKCKTLVLTLEDENNPVRDKCKLIMNVFKNKKNDYSRAKIKFKTQAGIDRTVEIDTTDDDGLNQAYVKKEKLNGFTYDLKASYEKFHQPILSKMKELLSQINND